MRDEIELVESLREQALQKLEETNRQNASRVKTETGPATTDAARRLFYSQRKKLADETVKQEEEWRAGVAENKQIHMQKAVEHAEAAKATRTQVPLQLKPFKAGSLDAGSLEASSLAA